MSSPPNAVPTLPHTWRAERTRRVVMISAVLLVVTISVVAILLPQASGFTKADRAAMVAISLALAAVLWALGHSRVTATADGLTIVNILRARRLEWAQVIAVRLGRNDPWAVLDLDDGSTVAAFAIATSDGERAQRAATALRTLVALHSATPRND